MSYFAWGPKNDWDKQKIRDGEPALIEVPKGWRSMHREVEYNLCILWPERDVKLPKRERRCLNKFHVKPKTGNDRRKENPLGLLFNPDVPRD